MHPRYRVALAVLLAAGLFASAAGATSVTHSVVVPLQSTDWSTTLSIPRHDPGTGLLTSVTVEVRDSLVHRIEFENKSPGSASRFNDSTYVTVDVLRPASTSLVTAVAKIYRTATVGVFDGTVDYAGTSGVTLDGIVGYATSTATLTAPADLALFSGTGTVGLPCQAVASFLFGYSGGNASFRLTTQALARVAVTYVYDPATPAKTSSWGRIKSLYR